MKNPSGSHMLTFFRAGWPAHNHHTLTLEDALLMPALMDGACHQSHYFAIATAYKPTSLASS